MRFLFAAVLGIVLLMIATPMCNAQWKMENSNTEASLRGVDSLGKGVAWASGTKGTVLRTVDDGSIWQVCPIPPGAEHLDFRGLQGVDKNTAIVMGAGKGDLSRIYKTTDGCHTWKLLFTNPDNEGFWDGMFYDRKSGQSFILGDPVEGVFVLYVCEANGQPCSRAWADHPPKALSGQSAFAASNSLLMRDAREGKLAFITGGTRSELVKQTSRIQLPFAASETGGAFSIAGHGSNLVVVGGDYKKPNARESTAAFSIDGGSTFLPAHAPPSGYRSSVAYDVKHQTWIAVGPNGTDLSIDGGRDWRAIEDTNGNGKDWNALSLPFVVGPHGRIGRVNDTLFR